MNRFDELTTSVTAQLIDMINCGGADGPGDLPWHRAGAAVHFAPNNAVTGKPYQGGNLVALALAGIERGYPTATYATYKQLASIGAQVRRGEHGTRIVKWVTVQHGDTDPTPEPERRRRLVPRVYAVFNVHQADGLEDLAAEVTPCGGVTEADHLLRQCDATVIHGGDAAYYHPGADAIYLPEPDRFTDSDAYYATALHEHIHWTGHPTRLNRSGIGRPFGSPDYAAEELIAELGAAIGCARLGITNTPRTDHARYLASWLAALDNDPKTLWRSATAAQRALDHLVGTAVDQTEAA